MRPVAISTAATPGLRKRSYLVHAFWFSGKLRLTDTHRHPFQQDWRCQGMRRELLVQSFIDTPRWDAAGWHGTAYLTDPDNTAPPVIALQFRDATAGLAIFEGWRDRVGAVDQFEEIRLSIVEGPIAGAPAGYSILVTSEPGNTVRRAQVHGVELDAQEVLLTARHHRMEPAPGSPHLSNFKKAFKASGFYMLAPLTIVAGTARPGLQVAIKKTKLHLRQAADIGQGDVESILLTRAG